MGQRVTHGQRLAAAGRSSDGATQKPLFWIRFWLVFFILSVIASGVSAIPLVFEVNVLYRALHYFGIYTGGVHDWVQQLYAALLDTRSRYPFLFYGTDWLAFGHFVIALAFVGPLQDPWKNVWVIRFGVITCSLVIPYALIFGSFRGIPWWWRLIDCSFGLGGMVPLLIALHLVRRLPQSQKP